VIADLHCHYPMRLLERVEPTSAYDRAMSTNRPQWLEKLRARVFGWAARSFNHPRRGKDWRVRFEGLEEGRCRLVLSVLYDPVAEIDLDEAAGPDPDRDYFSELRDQIRAVNRDLEQYGDRKVVVDSLGKLDGAGERIAFVHCVEGGFHLGRSGGSLSIDEKVAELAGEGVAYITLAHLFYRGVATNVNALPKVPDWLYNAIHCQPRGRGLSGKGEEIVRAMHRHRVLVDVSHMRPGAFRKTLGLLDQLDEAEFGAAGRHTTPVIASHAGFRFGRQRYMLDRRKVLRIARRGGVIGLILAQHQLQDGLFKATTLEQTADVACRHASRIRRITGSDEHVGIGSDLDGFIEPTMAGVDHARDLAAFEDAFRARYDGDADAILFGNAHRVIRRAFELRAS
jgi:microsomal dipeptidase-like Zn-dependent dipeptidase